MLNVVRCSQIIGWIAIDRSTANSLGELEEVWLDDSGRIAYFSGKETYLPVEGIAGTANPDLAAAVAQKLNIPLGKSLVERFLDSVDRIVCVMMPKNLDALAKPAAGIALWYEDFRQKTHAEVCELLTRQKLTTSNS
ncbi:hypothetical protein [Anabaena sp. CCY 9910]|uniref:hypothetical protein n=1 Tax=Anabaena sp. CCY 9910 TaxID=3103870 RepID=UPI0039E11A32